MRGGLVLCVAVLAAVSLPAAASAQAAGPKGPLNTMADIRQAFRTCWQWPPASASRAGIALTVRVSFKRNGEIFGVHMTYQSRHVSDEERGIYHRALLAALSRCSPLPLSAGLGEAIAGRPLTFHIEDTRQQRKA